MGKSPGHRLLYVGLALMLVAVAGGLTAVAGRINGEPVVAPVWRRPSATAGPAPTATTKPTALNTGVPAGTSLRVVRGDQTYSRRNQVISGLDIQGFVTIRAKNVTLRNSIVRGRSDVPCNTAMIHIMDGASATISDVEIAPVRSHPCLDGVSAVNATLRRLHVHGVVDGVKAFDNVVLEDSYVHDLAWFSNDPNQDGGETHNDAVQTYEGNRHIVLRRNVLDAGPKGNAAYQVTQDFGKASTDLHVEHNWLHGGGCTLNFSHSHGPTPMTGIYVVGNRFGRDSFYDCPILISTETVLTGVSGNVWDDTGTPIPEPQQHD